VAFGAQRGIVFLFSMVRAGCFDEEVVARWINDINRYYIASVWEIQRDMTAHEECTRTRDVLQSIRQAHETHMYQ
jgi:hypothetical protein